MTATSAEPTVTGEPRSRRRLVGVVAVVLVAVVVGGFALWKVTANTTAPYQDAAATSRLTLCDGDGRAVTEGSTTSRLAASVVGASGAAATDTVTLYAYQPREGVSAGEWTGIALTSSGPADAPLELGPDSITLGQFLGGYPATWDGWVQLRLVVTSPDGGAQPTYAAVDLQVDGDGWTATDPASATCPA